MKGDIPGLVKSSGKNVGIQDPIICSRASANAQARNKEVVIVPSSTKKLCSLRDVKERRVHSFFCCF